MMMCTAQPSWRKAAADQWMVRCVLVWEALEHWSWRSLSAAARTLTHVSCRPESEHTGHSTGRLAAGRFGRGQWSDFGWNQL